MTLELKKGEQTKSQLLAIMFGSGNCLSKID